MRWADVVVIARVKARILIVNRGYLIPTFFETAAAGLLWFDQGCSRCGVEFRRRRLRGCAHALWGSKIACGAAGRVLSLSEIGKSWMVPGHGGESLEGKTQEARRAQALWSLFKNHVCRSEMELAIRK